LHQTQTAILLDSESYLRSLLIRYGYSNCKPSELPMSPSIYQQLLAEDPSTATYLDAQGTELYQSIAGSLLYPSDNNRADLCQSIHFLCRWMSKPSTLAMKGLLQMLQYVRGTLNRAMVFPKSSKKWSLGQPLPLDFLFYSDSSFVDEQTSSDSTGGLLCFPLVDGVVRGSPVLWSSRKIGIVVRSAMESEYVQLAETSAQACWLRNILVDDLHFNVRLPFLLRADNQSAIALALNPISHPRTKHIRKDYHFTRQAIAQGVIKLEWCTSADNLTDSLTKLTARPIFLKFLDAVTIKKP